MVVDLPCGAPLKVALIVPGGVDRSGEHRVIPALLALLKRLATRHDVHAFALNQEPAPATWTLRGAHVHNIGGRNPIWRQARTVAAILRENGAAPFDIVHAIWSGGCGLVAVSAAKLLRLPSIVHVAGGELIALPQIGYGGRLTSLGRTCEAVVLRSASAVTAASAPIIAEIVALGHAGRRVPLGVDLESWAPRQPVRRDPGEAVRLVHVASLNRVKDQPTLLRAAALLAANRIEFHLDIVGADTLDGSVEALATQLNLASATTFHGFLTQQQLRPIVERAHVNLVSSLHEAGPLVVLESAVVGVPTVGTAVGHVAEWAPDAALAVPVGDAAALAAAIERLIADEDLRLRLAAEASRRALIQDADHTAALFEALYADLAADFASRHGG
jgi:glycosyltransferase involved in cell wall biosynthesis